MNLGEPGNELTDVIGAAQERKQAEVISLLEKFKANPTNQK